MLRSSSLVRPALALVAIAALVPLLASCQMSRSSSRSFAAMASIWSLSRSFQSSFGGGNRASLDEGYAFDVAVVGAAAAGSEAPEANLLQDVVRVAATHGVTDWEVLEETWLGLGIGLRHAGMSESAAEALVGDVFGDSMAERTLVAWVD